MNLGEIRQSVRDQMDLPDEEDLSTALLDNYIAEGYNHIINREAAWPFLEQSYTVTSVIGQNNVPLPSTLATIDSVTGPQGVLELTPLNDAEAYYEDDTGVPHSYSVWGDSLYLWPRPLTAADYTIRGWRKGSEDWMSSAAGLPDTGNERRMDRALVHYACYRAYAQQEDPELAEFYRVSFERVLADASQAIMRPKVQGRIIVGKGMRWFNRRRGYWVVD